MSVSESRTVGATAQRPSCSRNETSAPETVRLTSALFHLPVWTSDGNKTTSVTKFG